MATEDNFVHPALFYRTRVEYLDSLLPFIVDGINAGHPVMVAVPGPNLAALRETLGRHAAHVVMTDMTDAGRNPGRILGEVLSGFVVKHPGEPVRIVGEPIWPSRSEVEYPACVQHEALINHAFVGRDVTVVCPYDVAHLHPGVIVDACRTHPVLWRPGFPEQQSASYDPDLVCAHYNQPLGTHSAAVKYTVRSLADLSGARAFAVAYGQWFRLSATRTADLQLITNELATSSLMYAAGPCRLALWQHDGYLVCEARDRGRLDDPLAGRRTYDSDTGRGRALYVVNAIADLTRAYTGADETTIRAYLRLDEVA
ncbi:anti-sigma regulatory factor [Amycolatopsis mediterranei S699] [Mycobacterium shimoidei]|uniref:Anti-sigma regulatory factor [Amycolatopsis mediterranei S699] n=1 Tax=Mycobacterium shimoidei TaxID=29313 RepID=A0A375Z1S9_MYCSH|nr:sensor histidine kinase [Mycobacterium shimoidei]SRX95134.1 anti-sigma regulatory factor [Amycolatopsis mediterranei S699] [Mycobacterium shimoidei]